MSGVRRRQLGLQVDKILWACSTHTNLTPPLLARFVGKGLWNGKEKTGRVPFFMWQQGYASPVDQQASADCRLADEQIAMWRLPAEFWVYSYDRDRPFPVEAVGRTDEAGVWSTTELVTTQNMKLSSKRDNPGHKVKKR